MSFDLHQTSGSVRNLSAGQTTEKNQYHVLTLLKIIEEKKNIEITEAPSRAFFLIFLYFLLEVNPTVI